MSKKNLSLCFALAAFFASGPLFSECDCTAPVNLKQYLNEVPAPTNQKPPKELELLITGCARSGTLYITKVLKLHGLDVRHEWNADYGIVSWTMAVDSNKSPWGPASNKYRFKHVFHQVRHPLKAIASQMTEGNKSWDFIHKMIPQIKRDDVLLVKCAKYWYYWNLLAEGKSELTYRIENVASVLPEMSLRLGIQLDPLNLNRVRKTINTRHNKHLDKNLTWLDLRRTLNDGLYEKVVCLAKRYGYDVTEAERYIHKKKERD